MCSKKKNEAVDVAVAEYLEGASTIALTKESLAKMQSLVREKASALGVRAGLTFERLKKALKKLGVIVIQVHDCAKQYMASCGWGHIELRDFS